MITPDLILKPFAASATGADIQAPPQTSPTGFVNFTDGYTSFYEISLAANNPQAKAVERPIQNYLFNALTKNAQAWQAQGIPPWYGSMVGGYMKGALVFRANGAGDPLPYRSLVNNNVTDPVGNPASWEYWPSAAEALRNVPMPSGGPGGPSTIVVGVATDFNTFLNGTWVFLSQAVANGSPNAPVYPGSTDGAVAGSLESITWNNGSGNTTVQRYFDVRGQVYVRRGTDGSFPTPWVPQVTAAALQNGRMIFGATTGATNTYALSIAPAPSALVDGMVVNVRFHAANTAAATFNLNGLGAVQIAGGAYSVLVGTEINTNSLATLQYSAAANAWVIKNMVGSPVQGMPALKDNQLTTLGQVNQLIANAQINTVEWTNVLNKPNVAINGFSASFKSLELVDAGPYIDFHYNNDAADYNIRLVNDGDKLLSIYAKDNASPIAYFNDSAIRLNRVAQFPSGLQVSSGQVANFLTVAGTSAYWFTPNDSNFFMNYQPSAGGAAATSWSMNRSNGVITFNSRPIFGSATPWDSANFNPASYLLKGANANTNGVSFSYANGLDISNYTTANQGQLQIENANNGTPAIGFLRGGVYGAYLGMAVNNQLYWGGWSARADGTQGYVCTSYNLVAHWQNTMAAISFFHIGAYCLALQVDGGPAHAIGELVSSTGLIFCAVSGANISQKPAVGTWRCMAYSGGSGLTQASMTLWQRVA